MEPHCCANRHSLDPTLHQPPKTHSFHSKYSKTDAFPVKDCLRQKNPEAPCFFPHGSCCCSYRFYRSSSEAQNCCTSSLPTSCGFDHSFTPLSGFQLPMAANTCCCPLCIAPQRQHSPLESGPYCKFNCNLFTCHCCQDKSSLYEHSNYGCQPIRTSIPVAEYSSSQDSTEHGSLCSTSLFNVNIFSKNGITAPLINFPHFCGSALHGAPSSELPPFVFNPCSFELSAQECSKGTSFEIPIATVHVDNADDDEPALAKSSSIAPVDVLLLSSQRTEASRSADAVEGVEEVKSSSPQLKGPHCPAKSS